MTRSAQVWPLVALGALAALSCSERKENLPSSPRNAAAVGCPAPADLDPVAAKVFGSKGADYQALTGMIVDLAQRYREGKVADAKKEALDAVTLIKSRQSTNQLSGTQAEIDELIKGILCIASLTSADAEAVLVAGPSTTTQTVVSSNGQVGAVIPPGALTEPTVITAVAIPGTFANGAGPLTTKLDQYSGFYELHSQSATGAALVHPLVVAVCPSASVPAAVRARLRLGHQSSAGFEVTPRADGTFLTCSGGTASRSRVPAWLRGFASLVLPRPLYARMQLEERGGVGGSAIEFSPFAPVDMELRASGGTGGSAIEFTKSPAPGALTPSAPPGSPTPSPSLGRSPGSRLNTLDDAGKCLVADALPGQAVEPACRPGMVIRTHLGTVLQNVPISWTVTGGGSIAPETPGTRACGAFGSTATTMTDANGKAGVCWILGNPGPNLVVATPAAGGDAPAGVTFNPATYVFPATLRSLTPAASAVGVNAVYDGLPHPGSGSCSSGLTPVLAYSGGAVPTEAGTYTLTVTCGGGQTGYATTVATATITISPAIPTVNVNCPVSVVYDGAIQTPCTGTATGLKGVSLLPVVIEYVITPPRDAATYKATAKFAAAGNYGAGSATTTFVIAPSPTATTVTCSVATTVYTGLAQTPCSATVTGRGGLALTPSVTYMANTDAGTATASVSYAGAANYLPSTDSKTFTITRAPSTSTVTCPTAVAYAGAALAPCTATVTGAGGLNQPLAVSYTPSPVRNAGPYAAAATFAGDANHGVSAGGGSFTITPLPATATAGSGTKALGGANPTLPCVVGGLLGIDAGTVACTTTIPATPAAGTYVTTPALTATNANYVVTSVAGTLTVIGGYVQSGCFSVPLSRSMPPTTAGLPKGTIVEVECQLLNAAGAPVLNATGDLLVQDLGTSGTGPATTIVSATNAFQVFSGGVYTHNLLTTAAIYVKGHYYFVTAAWNDGSTTTGWFYLSP